MLIALWRGSDGPDHAVPGCLDAGKGVWQALQSHDTPVAAEAALLMVSVTFVMLSVDMQVLPFHTAECCVLTFVCCDIVITLFRCWIRYRSCIQTAAEPRCVCLAQHVRLHHDLL